MPILSECVGNSLSAYNAESLKPQVDSYIKGKIVECKIFLVIHMTIKFRVQLESSKSIFVMVIEERWLCTTCFEKDCPSRLSLVIAVLDADQEHIWDVLGNIFLIFNISTP